MSNASVLKIGSKTDRDREIDQVMLPVEVGIILNCLPDNTHCRPVRGVGALDCKIQSEVTALL